MNTYQLKKDTLEEHIRQFYLNGRELTDRENEIRARWEFADTQLIVKRESVKNTVAILMQRFGISQPMAYIDVRNAIRFFGDHNEMSKEYLRKIVTEWAFELYRTAWTKKDLKAMEGALERITKANNLDKQDPDIPDPSKIQPPVQLLQVNFSIIDSPRFKLIDEKTQKAILKVYDEVMSQIKNSPLSDYMDLFQVGEHTEDAQIIEDGD